MKISPEVVHASPCSQEPKTSSPITVSKLIPPARERCDSCGEHRASLCIFWPMLCNTTKLCAPCWRTVEALVHHVQAAPFDGTASASVVVPPPDAGSR